MKEFATSTARLEGAPTPATRGMPAARAFCRISKLVLPTDQEAQVGKGQAPASKFVTNDFINSVVAAHVLPKNPQVSVPVKQSGSMQTAGGFEHGLGFVQNLRQAMDGT